MYTQKTLPMTKFIVPAVSSVYPTLGNSYSHKGHQIEYSPRLVLTGKDYYASKAGIPKGERMSTAAEELAIQLGLEKAGQDPRQAGVFDDLFARNDARVCIWQWTATGLRVPKGRDPSKYETDAHGIKYWVRELLIENSPTALVLVPEGNGRIVVEWDEVSGLPRVTEDIAFPHKPYTTHFWFNPNPAEDGRSKNKDVALGRWGAWPFGGDVGCLAVAAGYARSVADSSDGFRPVRGSLPEIERELLT